MHHFKSAAGKTEGHRPQGTLTGPIGDLIKGGPKVQKFGVSIVKSNVLFSPIRDTYKTYCIAPSFFSWLARGTSFRTLPDAESDWPVCPCCSSAVADFIEEFDRRAFD